MLAGLEMLLWHGEKVGLIGPNGSGKSVFFDLLLRKFFRIRERSRLDPALRLGYYAQEHETLDYEQN